MLTPGPSDDSLRRAGMIRYAEDSTVPEACKNPSYYDEAKKTHVIPIIAQECLTSILGVDKSHIITAADVAKLVEWWAKNSKDTGTVAWAITGGPLRDLIGKPISTVADKAGETQIDSVDSVEKQARDALDFFGNGETWISFGMLALGLILIAYGGTRWIRG